MQKVNLNLIPGGVRPVVNVSQYDEGRQFQLAVFNGSASYDLTGKTVMIEVGKNDGNGCAYGVTDLVNTVPVVAVSGNIVTITTPVQMTACAGENIAELKIAESGNEIGTLNFILSCEQAALSPDTPISDTEIPALIDEAETNAQRAEDAVSHYPKIDDTTKDWLVWDAEQSDWVDTGVRAQGIDGQGGVSSVNNVLPDSSGNVALSLSSNASGILPTANGGTGNADGYIRTGQKANTTVGNKATIEGGNNTASGQYSHAEGSNCEATSTYSHAEGYAAKASGYCSHAEGNSTLAAYSYQHACGHNNYNDSGLLFMIGNGTSSVRNNAMGVRENGIVEINRNDGLVSGSNLSNDVEMSTRCTSTHAAGSYVYVVSEDQLYHVGSTAIQAQETISTNNASVVTIADELTALNQHLADQTLYFTSVACSATTGNFASVSNASISADHVVVECVFANPSAITSDVTWTTASGSLVLNGTCASATTASITLSRKGN